MHPLDIHLAQCASTDSFCSWVKDTTGNEWLAESSNWLIVKPFQILVIILIALLIRWGLHRLIGKLARRTGEGLPSVLKPMRERAPQASKTETATQAERRRQRATTMGQLLRSISTAVVFAVAGMMILAELGLNLAPILASAGVVGVALGIGAQSVVKDLLAGVFMLLEDQYGVGDTVDLGEASGTVEAVGLRVTTVRDGAGALWYVRNGEVVRVGNKSQGWAQIMLDIPIGYANVERATEVLKNALTAYADEEEHADDFIEPPSVLGVEQITIDGAQLRVSVKTTTEAQFRVARDLRGRIAEALEAAGIAAQVGSRYSYLHGPVPFGPGSAAPGGPAAGRDRGEDGPIEDGPTDHGRRR